MLLTVIIPIYNEAATCAKLIDRVKAVPIDKQIIVVDDGSTDGSREILEAIPGIQLLRHRKNRGKGAAVRTALPYTKGEYVIFQDGDLEYDPADFIRLLEPLQDGVADAVFGSRWMERTAPHTFHTLGNRLITRFSNRVSGGELTDIASCYKMLPMNYLRDLHLKSTGFGLEAEITAKVLRKGYRVLEIPIRYTRRSKKEGKKLRLKDGLVAVWSCVWYRFRD